MASELKAVTLVRRGASGSDPTLVVWAAVAATLVDWFATGKERTHTFPAQRPTQIGDDTVRVIDVTVARDHLAYIVLEDVREES